MRRVLIIFLGGLLAVAPTAAHAVWGGEPDLDRHPAVGAIYYDGDEDGAVSIFDIVCSLGYLGPSNDGQFDVVLTAAHCLPPDEENVPPDLVMVSFDNNSDDALPASPISVVAWESVASSGRARSDLRDLGVFLLPAGSVAASFPAAAASPVRLPDAGVLDEMKRAGDLKFLTVDAVGYGAIPIWNEPGGFQLTYDGVRRLGSMTVTGLTHSYVVYQQNPHSVIGGSGVCYGDSGSPNLFHDTDVIISVTSGGNPNCNAVNYNTRVDTPAAQEFLSRFVDVG